MILSRRRFYNRRLSHQPFQPPAAILGFIMVLGPFSIDLYLTIMPVIVSDLQADIWHVTFALSIYMLGFACGHFICGGLSDSLGRLRILLPGLISYIILNILAALSHNISYLIVIRGLQGVASAAVVTVIPALVYDCFETKKCARVLSLVMFQLMSVVPLVVITMSLVIVPLLGWRSVFGLLACQGIVMLFVVRSAFVETLAPQKRLSLNTRDVVKRYAYVFRRFSVVGYLIIQSLFLAGMLCFLAMSPAIYAYEYNVPVKYYGILYAISVSFGAVCCFINSRLINYFPIKGLIFAGLLCGTIASLTLLTLFFADKLSLAATVICTACYCGSFALVGPNASTLAFSKLPLTTGTVNSIGGVLRFSVSGLLTGLCASITMDSTLTLASMLLFCSVVALSIFGCLMWVSIRQRARAPVAVLPDATIRRAAANDEGIAPEVAA